MTSAATPIPELAAVLGAGRAAAAVAGTWKQVARRRPDLAWFDPAQTTALPEPARRWLTHAIAPGTPLAHAVILEMEGQIRIGRWRPFRAIQLHAPPDGCIWAARAALGPLHISGFDRYAANTGEMRWRLPGRIPVISATGPDLDRSAAGRVALDAVFVPTAFLTPAVTWRDGPGPVTVTAEWTIGSHVVQPELRIAPDGAIASVTAPRWGEPGKNPGASTPCGGTLDHEAGFGAIKIPTQIRAGYFFGTSRWDEGEFFRARITKATFLT